MLLLDDTENERDEVFEEIVSGRGTLIYTTCDLHVNFSRISTKGLS